MKRKLRVGRIIALFITVIVLMAIGIYAYDKYSYNAFIKKANDTYTLNINGEEVEPSLIKGEEFLFNEMSSKEIEIQVPKESVINLESGYKLTDDSGQVIDGEVTYLPDGNYTLVVKKDEFTYQYDLNVDNDFTVEIDQTNSYRAGWLVVDFYDLNENEVVEVLPNFTSSEYFIFKKQDMLIPISYDSVENSSTVLFSSDRTSIEEEVFITPTEFREDHFNIDTTVASNATQEPNPKVLESYKRANNSTTVESSYETGFTTPTVGYTTGDFGDVRYINGDETPTKIHYGIDYANEKNTTIYSTSSGVVTYADFLPGTGNGVIVDHGNGITSHYFHLNEINVKVGDVVNSESVIGKMGTTGFSTGDHLHFEIHINGIVINPYLMLGKQLNF